MKIDLATLRGLDAHVAAEADLQAHLEQLEKDADGQVMSDEQRMDFEETVETRDKLVRPAIAELKTRAARIADAADDARGIERPAAPQVIRTSSQVPENIWDLPAYQRHVRSFTELGAAYREGAKRAIEAVSYPTVNDRAKAMGAVTHVLDHVREEQGHEGEAARLFLITTAPGYQRAWAKYVSGGWPALTPDEARSLQSGSDANGGVGIPGTIDPTFILTSNGSANPTRAISRVIPITTKSWQPVTTAGVTAAYGTEIVDSSDAAPTDFAGGALTPLNVQVTVRFTASYAEDYGLAALQSEVGGLIQDAKDTLEATKFVLGAGTAATPDEPLGIVYKLIDEGSSLVLQNALDLDALDQLTGALPERFQDNATILGHRLIFTKIRQLGDAGFPANSIYDPLSSTIYGYPAKVTSTMDSATTAGKEPLLIGDFRYFAIIDRVGLSTEFVPHMVNGSGNLTGERAIFARWRNTTAPLTVNAFRLLQLY